MTDGDIERLAIEHVRRGYTIRWCGRWVEIRRITRGANAHGRATSELLLAGDAPNVPLHYYDNEIVDRLIEPASPLRSNPYSLRNRFEMTPERLDIIERLGASGDSGDPRGLS